jgi:hypothetical protein
MEYNAEQVKNAIHWAYYSDVKQYWVPRIQTLSGLRKCITSIVKQMGDYRIPMVLIKVSKNPDCPVCEGDGIDDSRPYKLCSCVEYKYTDGRSSDYWEYTTQMCKRLGALNPFKDVPHEKFLSIVNSEVTIQ